LIKILKIACAGIIIRIVKQLNNKPTATAKGVNGKMAIKKCKKCNGTGNVGSYREGIYGEFTYTVDNGTCWECNGKGIIDTEAKATKDDMQSVFGVIYAEHVRGEKYTTTTIIKRQNTRLTRVVVADAVVQMERMGLVKTKKEGKGVLVAPTKFGLERWRKRLEWINENYAPELL
jgi:hypothetical protein